MAMVVAIDSQGDFNFSRDTACILAGVVVVSDCRLFRSPSQFRYPTRDLIRNKVIRSTHLAESLLHDD